MLAALFSVQSPARSQISQHSVFQQSAESDNEELLEGAAPVIVKQSATPVNTLSRMRMVVPQPVNDPATSTLSTSPREEKRDPFFGSSPGSRPFSLPIKPMSFYNASLDENEENSSPTARKLPAFRNRANDAEEGWLKAAQIRTNRPQYNRSLLRRSSSMSEFDRIIHLMKEEVTYLSDSDEEKTDASLLEVRDKVAGLPTCQSFTNLEDERVKIRKRFTQEERRALKAKHKEYIGSGLVS